MEGNPNDKKVREFYEEVKAKQVLKKKDTEESYAKVMTEEEFKKWAADKEKKEE